MVYFECPLTIYILVLLICFAFPQSNQCKALDQISNNRTHYLVGETISIEDQQMEHDVCYGEYPNDTFRFADVNGDLNGGDYKVIMARLNASW